MKIRFLQGPNAGKIANATRSQETDLLIKSGIIELINEPLPEVRVTWGIHVSPLPNVPPSIFGTCSHGCGRFVFSGEPNDARHFRFLHAHSAPPESVPEEIIEQYKRSREGKGVVSIPDDEAAALSFGRLHRKSVPLPLEKKNPDDKHEPAINAARVAAEAQFNQQNGR